MSAIPKSLVWKAIRMKCLDCCCGSSNEVSLCPSEKCPLYPFRTGRITSECFNEIRANSAGVQTVYDAIDIEGNAKAFAKFKQRIEGGEDE